jgi:hypothetical protein
MVTIGLAAMFLNEEILFTDAIGMALVILGVAWFTINEARIGKQPHTHMGSKTSDCVQG